MLTRENIKTIQTYLLSSLGKSLGAISCHPGLPIQYITEKQEWSIYMDGVNICKQVNRNRNKKIIQISNHPYMFNNRLVHFGSQYMWTAWEKFLSTNNNYVSTFYLLYLMTTECKVQ